ncbi:hypothetical protein AB6E53_06720 [Vibrio breoganii]
MKVEQQSQNITPAHDGVVFANKQDADKKDMSKAIGRFDAPRRSIVFVKDNGLGTKYKALADNGFQIHLAKDDRNNYFITDLLDNISKSGMHESVSTGEDSDIENKDNFKDDEGNSSDRPDLVFKEESDFMEQDIDDAMDLDITTESLNYEHRVGLYSESGNSYTLREDTKDLLDEFEFNIDENEEGVVARIAPESMNARKLLKLVNLLKKQEQDDEDELQEALDSNKVSFDNLPIVKSLLRRLSLAQKHGEQEESDDAEIELNELIKQYSESNPPATGIDKVEQERSDILTKKESSTDGNGNTLTHKTQKQTQSAPNTQSKSKPKSGGSVKKAVKKMAKAVTKRESLDDKLKAEADKARLAESILAESGIQVRGQQHV